MFKHSAGDDLHGDDLLVPGTIHISASVNVLFKMEWTVSGKGMSPKNASSGLFLAEYIYTPQRSLERR